MRDITAISLFRHIAVKFLIDDREFLSRQHACIFIIGPETVVIEQIFAPVIGADEGNLPICAKIGKAALMRTNGAFAGG